MRHSVSGVPPAALAGHVLRGRTRCAGGELGGHAKMSGLERAKYESRCSCGLQCDAMHGLNACVEFLWGHVEFVLVGGNGWLQLSAAGALPWGCVSLGAAVGGAGAVPWRAPAAAGRREIITPWWTRGAAHPRVRRWCGGSRSCRLRPSPPLRRGQGGGGSGARVIASRGRCGAAHGAAPLSPSASCLNPHTTANAPPLKPLTHPRTRAGSR